MTYINERAEKEIQKLHNSGLIFEYEFDYTSTNKHNIAINKVGYSMEDVVSELDTDEHLIFMLNDGKTYINNNSSGAVSEFSYNEKYDGSIYWEHKIYGNWVRVSSSKGSLHEWVERKNTYGIK